jgi:hypothetical protein
VRHTRTFRSFGIPAIELCHLVGVRFPGSAVESRQFSDQLGNRHAELGRAALKDLRGALIDLDADVGAHGTRIADPEPVSDGSRSRFPVVSEPDGALADTAGGARGARGAPRRSVGQLALRSFRFGQAQEHEDGAVERPHFFGGE